MNSSKSDSRNFEKLRSGLQVVTQLEDRVDDDDDLQPQLRAARSYLAEASRQVETAGLEREFSKAMGYAASVALNSEHDDLAEDALDLGGVKAESIVET
ncbi:hypothetical protein [Halosimplex halobium]|uniref:hypothetical protein n=1 Tax=Halosimplex halobium TaxID=3396618 RepID=UPI003F57CD13